MSIVSEILYFILIGIIILHSLKFHGKIYTIRIILVGFLMGFIIENAGVVQGSYTEWGYLFYIPGSFVPLVTQIGWIVVTYISISLAGTIFKAWPILKRHFSLAATITALIATCWDIVVDPYAVLHGNWVWTSQSLGATSYWMVGGSDYQLDRMVLLYFRLDTFNLLHRFQRKRLVTKKASRNPSGCYCVHRANFADRCHNNHISS